MRGVWDHDDNLGIRDQVGVLVVCADDRGMVPVSDVALQNPGNGRQIKHKRVPRRNHCVKLRDVEHKDTSGRHDRSLVDLKGFQHTCIIWGRMQHVPGSTTQENLNTFVVGHLAKDIWALCLERRVCRPCLDDWERGDRAAHEQCVAPAARRCLVLACHRDVQHFDNILENGEWDRVAKQIHNLRLRKRVGQHPCEEADDAGDSVAVDFCVFDVALHDAVDGDTEGPDSLCRGHICDREDHGFWVICAVCHGRIYTGLVDPHGGLDGVDDTDILKLLRSDKRKQGISNRVHWQLEGVGDFVIRFCTSQNIELTYGPVRRKPVPGQALRCCKLLKQLLD
eukprot:comp22496_c0_seq1/m.56034 comp22496_c0_seq1/g.56034  ORF comp22496_c0_seq1/g.56034 comp22496_c0_seq1/m.56034 type:complete len:338 (+) comp22496_c0_seq1:1567-2580(+)